MKLSVYSMNIFNLIVLLDLTSTALAIKGTSFAEVNRNLKESFKVTKVDPKESKNEKSKGKDPKNSQDVKQQEDDDDGVANAKSAKGHKDNKSKAKEGENSEDVKAQEEEHGVANHKTAKGPKYDENINTKNCRKPKTAPNERQHRQRHIRVLQKGGPKESKAGGSPKEPKGEKGAKAPKGGGDNGPSSVSSNQVGSSDANGETYCLHGPFSAEQCSDLLNGSLSLQDGSIQGNLNVRVINDMSASETLESMDDVLVHKTRAKYIGCDGVSNSNQIRKYRLMFQDDSTQYIPTESNDLNENDRYPTVTAVNFSDMEIDEQECGKEIDDTTIKDNSNACSLIKTRFEIQYMSNYDDVTAEQEDEMYDLLAEIMQKQLDDGDFANVGDVHFTLGSLSSGTSKQNNNGIDHDGGATSTGIPVGVAAVAAMIVAIVILYYLHRRGNTSSVANSK